MSGLVGIFVFGVLWWMLVQAAPANLNAPHHTTIQQQHHKHRITELFDPIANPKAIVTVGNARFTILTSCIIRMEYQSNKQFQDAATFAFIRRNLPVPQYTVNQTGNGVMIATDNIQLKYTISNTTFSPSNLQASILVVNGTTSTWRTWTPQGSIHDEMQPLPGTIRTLDGNQGRSNLDCRSDSGYDRHCEYGIISKQGYVVIDDTHHLYYDSNDYWPWLVPTRYKGKQGDECNLDNNMKRDCGYMGISQQQCLDRGCCYSTSADLAGVPSCYYSSDADQDLYLFGHGLNYKKALAEFILISGSIPMPPRYAFGVFFSRYWAYNDIGEMVVVNQYESHNVPLDVLVTDMDWHLTFYKQAAAGVHDQAGQQIGWTGFTWDPHLFPNPKAFLDWCKARGLKNTLNLHPASGIQPWEEKYQVMANAMGIDPTTQKYVPFNITDLHFTKAWNQLVLKPHEDSGINFWWLDWQQGETWIDIPYVNPTQWLNYVFFTNPDHWNNGERPLILHRWGGLGNHRYEIGFSGDVIPSWESLANQPWFTASAANVGYGYWSHDLGGHTAPSPPELYTRWIQWGTFSPIFRTHCTKNHDNDRRIWVYPDPYYSIMRNFHVLRQRLVPTIYTEARRTYETGVSIVHPLYYEYPEYELAYTYEHEYMFGHNILVAPIVTPVDSITGMATQHLWFPPHTTWINLLDGQIYDGMDTGVQVQQSYRLDEMPVFVKAGQTLFLLPENTPSLGSSQRIPTQLNFLTFMHASLQNITTTSYLYEDDGISNTYQQHAWVQIDSMLNQDGNGVTQVIHPASCCACFLNQPSTRTYHVEFRGVLPATMCSVNGQNITEKTYKTSFSPINTYSYDGTHLSVLVDINIPQDVCSQVVITCNFMDTLDNPHINGYMGKQQRFIQAKITLDYQWGTSLTVYQDDYPSLLSASITSSRITADPMNTVKYLQEFDKYSQDAITEIQILNCDNNIKQQLLAQLQ